MKFVEKIKNLIKNRITFSQREREISKSRAIGALRNREIGRPAAEVAADCNKSQNQKTISEEMAFGREGADKEMPQTKNPAISDEIFENSALQGISRVDADNSSIASSIILSRGSVDISHEAVEAGGVAPPGSQRQPGMPLLSTPTANPSYQENSDAATSKIKIACPYCSSAEFVKRGTRQKKRERVQLYICKSCSRTFTPFSLKGKHYPLNVILDAISYYNLGFSLEQVSNIMKKKKGVEIQPSTVANWYEEHKEICAYHRMRHFAVKEFSPYDVIETCTLAHRQLYRFRYHRAKTKYIMEDDFKHYKFYPLKEFLENVSGECPHQYFQEGLRMSEAPLIFSKTEMIVRSKENFATHIAKLILEGVEENKQRHEALQKFMIANDSVTVATEVPVYLKREDLAHMQTQLGFKVYRPAADIDRPSGKQGTKSKEKQSRQGDCDGELRSMSEAELPKLITGHIDFLQIRNGSIHILDYKSNAAKERPIEQLTLYALALSRLTGLRVFHFKCAWFDEKDYFEFFPLHAVYKPRRGRKKVYTKEGEYDINNNARRMENLRPVKI